MPTLSAYILRQTMKPLTAAVVIALMLLLLERLLRLMDLVLNSKGSLNVLLKMLAFLVPHYLGLALPAAFFIGILLTFSRLQRDSEFDALSASGVGLHQLLRPTLGLAVLLALVTALIFSSLQPHARYTYRALVHSLSHGPLNKYLQDGVFVEIKGTTYMAEQIDSERRQFRRVFAFQEQANGSTSAVTARQGELIPRPDSPLSTLVLVDGVRLTLSPAKEQPATGPPDDQVTSTVSFDRYNVPVELEQDQVFRERGIDERELTLAELWRYRNSPPEGATPSQLIGEFNDRLVRIVSVLFLPILAIPLGIGGRRAQKSYGILFGIVILVAYNKILNTGENLVSDEGFSPWLAQWLPFLIFAVGSCLIFYRAAFVIGKTRFLQGSWQLSSDVSAAIRGLFRRPERVE